MIVILNGPLGIGKTTLSEALSESIEWCARVSGDAIAAVNPAAADELEHLHAGIAMLVEHHRRFGYRHFVIEHIWTSSAALGDLLERLAPDEVRSFRLALSEDDNLQRIARRATARENDESEFELRTLAAERHALAAAGAELGEPFDVSAPVVELVARLKRVLNLEEER